MLIGDVRPSSGHSHRPQHPNRAHPSFAEVLGQLSPQDVRLFQVIDDSSRKVWESNYRDRVKRNTAWIRKRMHATDDAHWQSIRLSLINLERLGLCTPKGKTILPPRTHGLAPRPIKPGEPWMMVDTGKWHVTPFGHRFMSACSEPGTYWQDGQEKQMLEMLAHVRANRRTKKKMAEA